MHRIAPLDGMRALAVAAVVATHALPHRFAGGVLGVDVFFVISGYVITRILLRERAESGRVDLRGFYARRFLRLGPALVAYVAVASVAGALLGYPHPLADAVAALTFTSNAYYNVVGEHLNTVGHTWSLAVEEQFYLLWPPVVAILLTRGRRVLAVVAMAVVTMPLLNAVLLREGVPGDELYRLPHTRLPELLAGAAVAVLVANPWHVPELARWSRNPVLPWTSAALLSAAILEPVFSSDLRIVLVFPVVGAAVSVVILHVVYAPEGLMARLLSWRPLVHVGLISYGIYLWHYLAIVLAEEVTPGRLRFAISLPLMLLCAELSWRYVEGPFNRYKDRRYGRAPLTTRPDPVPEPALP